MLKSRKLGAGKMRGTQWLGRASALALGAALFAAPAHADLADIGRKATKDEVHAWDHDVRPDGLGLPKGKGSVEEGEIVYSEQCAMCHGDFAEGAGRWPVLAGGQGTLTSDDPNKTIGSYWPYLSTVWDYINEAMPFGNARSLTDDQIYGITAFLLYMNDLVEEDFVLTHKNFQDVRLPNEANFYFDDRDQTEVPLFSQPACMSDCRDPAFKVVARAADIDVTPESGGGGAEQAAIIAEISGGKSSGAGEEVEEAPAGDAELIAKGEKVFKKCKACHQVGASAKNSTGPILNAMIGATPGAVEGFKYSKAMEEFAATGAVWDEATLAEFLKNPKGMMPKTKMSFVGLKEGDIAPIMAYLAAN